MLLLPLKNYKQRGSCLQLLSISYSEQCKSKTKQTQTIRRKELPQPTWNQSERWSHWRGKAKVTTTIKTSSQYQTWTSTVSQLRINVERWLSVSVNIIVDVKTMRSVALKAKIILLFFFLVVALWLPSEGGCPSHKSCWAYPRVGLCRCRGLPWSYNLIDWHLVAFSKKSIQAP